MIGIVIVDGKYLYYEYDYQGLILRDSWIYVFEDEYQFIVGIWENGDWVKKFYEVRFIRLKND